MIMDGSGRKEVLELIYADNVVSHIFSGSEQYVATF